jgi:hypothetical protein
LLIGGEGKLRRQSLGDLPRRAQLASLEFADGHCGTADPARELLLGQIKRFAAQLEPLPEWQLDIHNGLYRFLYR